MPTSETATFKPTENWYTDKLDGPLDEAVGQARDKMNREDTSALIDSLKEQVRYAENGVAYAVLKSDKPEEYSDSEALVMFNPFANPASSNMLVRAEFIREVARFSNVRDEAGKLKPVIMLASPGRKARMGSQLNLTGEERGIIKKGDLGPAAKELLHAVSTLEVGKVAMLGFSQGADMALAGARKAYSVNLDTTAVSVGDPSGVEKRNRIKLGIDFSKAGPKQLKDSVKRTGLTAQDKAADTFGDLVFGFGLSAAQKINRLVLAKGMGKNSFETHAQDLLRGGELDKLVVAYGSNSEIAKPKAIEPALHRLHSEFDAGNILTSIRVEGGDHTWGDQLTLLARLYMRALT